ncbi:hypothetical protein [Streptomyces sp. NBC_01445]|uniref:hypothetical protein n=1 Tax=Streptomyces sp. NBC_01445 TaxID=2903869 RepID=UPI002DDC4AB9|nr:hypothetical protein [Streptomyces sp. NBC_01445]
MRALAEGVAVCPRCRPDTELGVLDQGRSGGSRGLRSYGRAMRRVPSSRCRRAWARHAGERP